MMIDVIFIDLDGTLTQKPSLEIRFFNYLRHKNIIGAQQWFGLIWTFFRWGYKPHITQLNKGYIYGLDMRTLAQEGENFVSDVVPSITNTNVLKYIESIKTEKSRLVLLTGCLEVIAKPIAKKYHFDTIATIPRSKKGKVTLGLPIKHPYLERKLIYAQEYCQHYHLNLKQSAAIGDSRHDIPLLTAVGLASVHAPDKQLLATATQNDWLIL